MPVAVGDSAPEFSLKDQSQKRSNFPIFEASGTLS